MGYTSPWLKNKAICASDAILFSIPNPVAGFWDAFGSANYQTELTGVVSESLIYPSTIRFTVDFTNQVDFKILINGVTVWSYIALLGVWTTVSQDISFSSSTYTPGDIVEVMHRRNGGAGAHSLFRNFTIRGTSTPIILT